MIHKLLRKLTFTIILAVVLIIVSLIVASQLTGTNQFEVIIDSVETALNRDQSSREPEQLTPLEVIYTPKELLTLQNSATFTIKTSSELVDPEGSKYEIFLSQMPDSEDKYFWYIVKINNIGIGEFNQKIQFTDKNNSTAEIQVKGQRQSFNLPFGLSEISDWESFSYTANGDSFRALVDKQNKLPLDYSPVELVEVNRDLLLYTNSSDPIFVTKEAGEALKAMANELQNETGKNLVITSGFRSYNDQYRIYAGWVRQLGQDEADKVSARPGFSEHQLGTAIDFVDQESGFNLTNDFENTVAGRWLMQNASKYGFVQSYPINKEAETGYQHEAWHWRFVGVDNAKEFVSSGLTLNQWLSKFKNI